MAVDVLIVDQAAGRSPGMDRRRAVRYQIVQRCLVRPADALGAGSWPGIAHNISTTGIGLVLPYPIRAGTLLTIEPWGKPRARTLQARVVHSSPLAYLLLHGCQFKDPLTAAELLSWLA